jgi:hypothetical protein
MNLNETMQHIFDTVVPLLIQQGKGSVRKDLDGYNSSCMYRGEGGTKCAIGWLIADDLYSPFFERHGAVRVMDRLNWMPNPNLNLTEFSRNEVFHEFLHKLQFCHDRVADSEDFVKAFKQNCIIILSVYVSTSALQD